MSSEIIFRELFDLATDCMLILGSDGLIKEINRVGHEQLGYTKAEMLGKHISQFISPEFATILGERIAELLEKNFLTYESAQVRKDGTVLPVEISSRKITVDGQNAFFSVVRDVSGRKKIEKALKAREERFQTLFNRASEGIVIMSTSGKLIAVNESFARMHGYTPQEMQDMDLKDLDTPDSFAQVPERMLRLVSEGFHTFETENYHKDGHVFPLEVSASLITIDGEPVIQSFSRDITDRKIAEKELQKIQSGLNSAQKLAHIGSWEWGLSDNTALWSDETYRIFGIDKNDLNEHRKNFLDMIVPEDRAKVDLALNDALNDTKKYDVEYRICVADGKVKDIHALAEVIRDEAGKPTGMYGTVQDISDRRKIERALHESEERLSSIMNNSPAVIFMKDKAGRYLFVNSHFEKLFNITNAAMLGMTDYNLFPQEVADAVTRADQEVIQSEKLLDFEEQIPINDKIYYYLSHKFPVRNASNEVYAICGIAIDITERKIAEQSMRIASIAFETHDSIMITDANANIIRVNQAFQDTTGYSAEDVIGKNPRILSSGRNDNAFYAAMWKQLLGDGTWTGEIWDKRKNGQLYPKWMTITAVKD